MFSAIKVGLGTGGRQARAHWRLTDWYMWQLPVTLANCGLGPALAIGKPEARVRVPWRLGQPAVGAGDGALQVQQGVLA